MLTSRKQIDNVGHRIKRNEELPIDRDMLVAYREFRCKPMPLLLAQVSDAVVSLPCLLACRPKRIDTIMRKLKARNQMSLTYMSDIVGFRILCGSRLMQDNIVDRLMTRLPIKITRDHRRAARESGYRGFHADCLIEQRLPNSDTSTAFTFEVQVRTFFQHLWATESESLGEAVKAGGGSSEQRGYLSKLSRSIHEFEDANPDFPQEFVSQQNRPSQTWAVINFDKETGRQVVSQVEFDVFDRAMSYFHYQEQLFLQDMTKEIVLLGTNGNEESLKKTHLRYWVFKGRPTIPKSIDIRT
jgi:Region found in RelA / SpoT proteins